MSERKRIANGKGRREYKSMCRLGWCASQWQANRQCKLYPRQRIEMHSLSVQRKPAGKTLERVKRTIVLSTTE
jgi:hypothetical protein